MKLGALTQLHEFFKSSYTHVGVGLARPVNWPVKWLTFEINRTLKSVVFGTLEDTVLPHGFYNCGLAAVYHQFRVLYGLRKCPGGCMTEATYVAINTYVSWLDVDVGSLSGRLLREKVLFHWSFR